MRVVTNTNELFCLLRRFQSRYRCQDVVAVVKILGDLYKTRPLNQSSFTGAWRAPQPCPSQFWRHDGVETHSLFDVVFETTDVSNASRKLVDPSATSFSQFVDTCTNRLRTRNCTISLALRRKESRIVREIRLCPFTEQNQIMNTPLHAHSHTQHGTRDTKHGRRAESACVVF